MKKSLITLAALMLAVSTQAATINWVNTTSSKIVGLDGVTALTSANAIAAGFAVQLMFLDSAMVSYPGVATVGAAVTPASMSTKTAGLLTSASDTYTFNTHYTTGDEFFVRATATFGGTDYYMDIFQNNTYGDTFAIAATTDSGTDNFVWTNASYGGTGTVGDAGKWIAVPEPATGMLALAGVAMLIRRRRRA